MKTKETLTAYKYAADGKYISTITLDDSDKSPSGSWNIPGNMTVKTPPEERDGYDRYFVGGEWEYREIPQPEKEPEPTLDELKERKIAELKMHRDAEETEPVAYNSYLFDYDDKSRDRLAIARQSLEDAGGGSITWTTADNDRVDLAILDFAAINTAVAKRANALHVKYNELKEMVNAAQTAEEVAAIEWEDF